MTLKRRGFLAALAAPFVAMSNVGRRLVTPWQTMSPAPEKMLMGVDVAGGPDVAVVTVWRNDEIIQTLTLDQLHSLAASRMLGIPVYHGDAIRIVIERAGEPFEFYCHDVDFDVRPHLHGIQESDNRSPGQWIGISRDA